MLSGAFRWRRSGCSLVLALIRYSVERLVTGLLFEVAAKLEAHGGEQLCGEIVFAAGSESLVERSAEHWGRGGGLDGRQDGPAAFAGVGDAAGVAFEGGLF